jgi:hypothetical protein
MVPLIALLFWIAPTNASKKMRPLTVAEVSRVWIGISEDEHYIFRLSLTADGKGFGAYSYLDNEPRLFQISTWQFEPPSIYIKLKPATQAALVADQLKGEVSGMRMQLRMSGKGWSRSVSFRREEDLVERWERVKDAMRQVN